MGGKEAQQIRKKRYRHSHPKAAQYSNYVEGIWKIDQAFVKHTYQLK